MSRQVCRLVVRHVGGSASRLKVVRVRRRSTRAAGARRVVGGSMGHGDYSPLRIEINCRFRSPPSGSLPVSTIAGTAIGMFEARNAVYRSLLRLVLGVRHLPTATSRSSHRQARRGRLYDAESWPGTRRTAVMHMYSAPTKRDSYSEPRTSSVDSRPARIST
jgi:hypothetical protein